MSKQKPLPTIAEIGSLVGDVAESEFACGAWSGEGDKDPDYGTVADASLAARTRLIDVITELHEAARSSVEDREFASADLLQKAFFRGVMAACGEVWSREEAIVAAELAYPEVSTSPSPEGTERGTDRERLDALEWLLHRKGEDVSLLATSRGYGVISSETYSQVIGKDPGLRSALDRLAEETRTERSGRAS